MKDLQSILRFHRKYIYLSNYKSIVQESIISLVPLSFAIGFLGNFKSIKIRLTSKCLKHIYDKRPAEEYDKILMYLDLLIRFPDQIFENKNGGRGDRVLVKMIEGFQYLVVLERQEDTNYIVTFFRVKDEKYLHSMKEIWKLEGGIPHRNTLDATN